MLKNITKRTVNNINYFLILKRDAGHSKWANIRHIKAQKDGQKSLMFTKIGRQIKVAIQEGGSPEPSRNLKLAQVIEQAKRLNMPVASIQSVIKSMQTDKSQCKTYLLEMKGPGSCGILCEIYTDNLNSVKMSMATILKKHSTKFSEGIRHLFEEKGIIEVEAIETGRKIVEKATEDAIEVGAEDIKYEDNRLEFICDPNAFLNVQRELEKLNYKITNASVEYIPIKVQLLNDLDLEKCSSLYDKLEKIPEVVRLYDNIA